MSELAHDVAGTGPPLVLLHGLGADRHVWAPVLDRLAAERTVYTVDLPGFGGSPPLTGEDFAPPALAAAVSGWLGSRSLDRGGAHLAGNSLGGWVALETALRGDAATVTALAPAGLWPRPLAPKPEVARTLARLSRPLLGAALRSPRVRRLALYGSVAHPDRVPPEDAVRLVRAYAGAKGFTRVNRAMRAGTFKRLAEIDVPVTVVWAEHDQLVAPVRLPGSVEEVQLRDAGHVPMWDAPGAVADALLAGSARAEVATREAAA